MRYLLQYRRYRLAFRMPVRTAHGFWPAREGLIVRLEDETGTAGYGEAAPLPDFGTETVDEAEQACRELGVSVDAERMAALPSRLVCLRHALAAARDISPLAAVHPYIGVAALLPAGRAALEQVRARADAGFRVFKWKVGVGDVADELSLLDDICAALPEGAKLRLDANGAWDRRRSERWLERCAERPVEFVEQPIARNARGAEDLLTGLAHDYPTPLALDESLVGEDDIERWLGAGWPGVFVVKPLLVAKVASALQALERAKAKVVFSSALETAVGAREALQTAFAWRGEGEKPRALGFGVWPLFSDPRFDGPAAAPFIRVEDLERIDAAAIWAQLEAAR